MRCTCRMIMNLISHDEMGNDIAPCWKCPRCKIYVDIRSIGKGDIIFFKQWYMSSKINNRTLKGRMNCKSKILRGIVKCRTRDKEGFTVIDDTQGDRNYVDNRLIIDFIKV